MNIELAQKVLAHIKEHREAFDMTTTIECDAFLDVEIPNYPCGTVACLAGWIILLEENKLWTEEDIDALAFESWSEIKTLACDLLGISFEDGSRLFVIDKPIVYEKDEDDAIATFENFIESKKRDAANLIDRFTP